MCETRPCQCVIFVGGDWISACISDGNKTVRIACPSHQSTLHIYEVEVWRTLWTVHVPTNCSRLSTSNFHYNCDYTDVEAYITQAQGQCNNITGSCVVQFANMWSDCSPEYRSNVTFVKVFYHCQPGTYNVHVQNIARLSQHNEGGEHVITIKCVSTLSWLVRPKENNK